MASYKEIVTKAVIGKGRKTFISTSSVVPSCNPDTILGCWIINHDFKGYKTDDSVIIEGKYDVNIWYSCEGNSKTEVTRQTDTYKEIVVVPVKNEIDITGSEEVIVRSLKQPICTKVEIQDGKITYIIEKDLGIEIVGDTKVRIVIDEKEDEWDLIEDAPQVEKEVEQAIDEQVNEEFL